MTLNSTLLTLFASPAQRRKWEIAGVFGRNGFLELVLFCKNYFMKRRNGALTVLMVLATMPAGET
jgi:hypothetical protein